MTRKIPFSKLEQTCAANPTKWQYFYSDGVACVIVYELDDIRIYVSQCPVNNIIDCIQEKNLVLSIDDLLHEPQCEHISNDVLYEVLARFDLLEKE
jgi:hypothetical protein